MKRSLTVIFAIIALLVLSGTSILAVPSTINYQGKLTTSGGVPLQGTYSVQFTLWDHLVGGNIKWQETQSITSGADGSFAVLLGSIVPFIDTMFQGCQPALGITVGSDPEISPRLPFTAVPYAYLVSTIDGAKGGTLWGKLTVGSQNTNTGDYAFVAGQSNTASAAYTTIPGGSWNSATADHATVSGGSSCIAGGQYSVVGGGTMNNAASYYSTIAGGSQNYTGGIFGAVGGGVQDSANGIFSAVGGGYLNSSNDSASVVAGGVYNKISEHCSAIGGGSTNSISGAFGTIPGGSSNSVSGKYAFAAGRLASAQHAGAFVWADSTNTGFSSSTANQFSVRASGGTRIYSNNSLTSGVTLAAGASAWASVSDSTAKRNIRPVDGTEILSKLDQLQVSRWSYKAQDPDIEHIGPMAQDFYALFHVGENNTTISTIDPSGIALAAVKELNKKVREIDALKAEVRELKAMVAKLAADHGARNGGN